jgi:hypothetical protein
MAARRGFTPRAEACAYLDISVATGIDCNRVRVAPPKKNSFSRDWL